MDIVVGSVTVVDEDQRQARALARREASLYLPIVATLDPTVFVEPERIAAIEAMSATNDWSRGDSLIPDELLAKFAFSGRPADIIEHVERLFEAGASRVEFGTPHGSSSEHGLRLLGEEVLPALKQRA